MPIDPSLPPYPPARVWSYPPPPVRRRWFWVALAGTVLTATLATTLVVAAVDAVNTDAPGLIQDPRVLERIDVECAEMTAEVESFRPGPSQRALAQAIADQNQIVSEMVERISSLPADVLGEDEPTLAWLDDWRTLVDARRGYAIELVRGTDDDFSVPRDTGGQPIDERMGAALIEDVCPVPDVLVDPRGANDSSI